MADIQIQTPAAAPALLNRLAAAVAALLASGRRRPVRTIRGASSVDAATRLVILSLCRGPGQARWNGL